MELRTCRGTGAQAARNGTGGQGNCMGVINGRNLLLPVPLPRL